MEQRVSISNTLTIGSASECCGFPLENDDAVEHSTAEQLFENALAAQRRGSLADARRLYASVMRIDQRVRGTV